MGLDAATEALRWGVNDLGGTLMEENITRMAGQLPRRAAGARGPGRPPRIAPAARPPSARRSTTIRERYPVGVLPESPLDQVATGDVAPPRWRRDSRARRSPRRAWRALKAEIAELEGPVRAALAKKIKAAREEGDLSENAEYHALKEEQGHLETKILRLTERLRNAVVVEASERRRRRRVRQHRARHRPRGRPRADVHARRADRGGPQGGQALVGVAGRPRADGRGPR